MLTDDNDNDNDNGVGSAGGVGGTGGGGGDGDGGSDGGVCGGGEGGEAEEEKHNSEGGSGKGSGNGSDSDSSSSDDVNVLDIGALGAATPSPKRGDAHNNFTTTPSFSVRSEGSFNMATIYENGISAKDVNNAASSPPPPLTSTTSSGKIVSKTGGGADADTRAAHSDSDGGDHSSDDGSDFQRDRRGGPQPGREGPGREGPGGGRFQGHESFHSARSNSWDLSTAVSDVGTTMTGVTDDEGNCFRVTDHKPTPVPSKSPIVPRLGLDFMNMSTASPGSSPAGKKDSPIVPKLSMGDLGRLSNQASLNTLPNSQFSDYSDESDSQDENDVFSPKGDALSAMVALGSARGLGVRSGGGSRGSFGSLDSIGGEDGGRGSLPHAGSGARGQSPFAFPASASAAPHGAFTSPRILASPRNPHQASPRLPLPSPRMGGYAARESPRDEDYPAQARPHKRTSKHNLIPDGHENVSLEVPIRTSSMAPSLQIYSPSGNGSGSSNNLHHSGSDIDAKKR
jgi:hypothetical protein